MPVASNNDYSPDIYRRRDTTVDVAVVFVGTLFVGGEGGDADCVGSLDYGVEVEDGFVRLVAEVGEVEDGLAILPPDAGDKLADLHIELDRVNVDDIVGTGVAGSQTWVEFQLDMEAVGREFPLLPSVAGQELHPTDKTRGE